MAFEAAVVLAFVLVLGCLVIACIGSLRIHAILRRRRRHIQVSSSESAATVRAVAPELPDPLPLYEPPPPPHILAGGDDATTDIRPAPIAPDGLAVGGAAIAASSSSSQHVLGVTTPRSTGNMVADV
ncbi:hypothetical protein HK405_012105, partial [Cladochytrium tenue]